MYCTAAYLMLLAVPKEPLESTLAYGKRALLVQRWKI
jgi:hypothetical protein